MAYTTEDKIAFIKSLYGPARTVAEETGCSWELILAQAAQEVGWGEKVLEGTNNIFNIKADSSWKGQRKVFRVWERVNGETVWVDDPFRVYPDITSALQDRVAFLASNPRYTKAGLFDDGVRGSLIKEAQALQKAGYATDEGYADQLEAVFRGRTMRRAIEEAEKAGCCQQKRDWAFPFPDKEGKRIDSAAPYLGEPGGGVGALARSTHGFFPIGANGLWHGGIHFSAETGTVLSQFDGVRCIKDGEVVAYRVDKQYPEVSYPNGKKAAYSTGFTLVRHTLQLPGPSAAASAQGPDASPRPVDQAQKELVFFSLYMHLIDVTGLDADSKLVRPHYWPASDEFVVGEKAKDRQEVGAGGLIQTARLQGDVEDEMECGCVEYIA